MSDPIQNLGVLSKIAAEALPAAVGAMISMRFVSPELGRGQRFVAAMCAYAIGTYFGRGVCAYLLVDNPRVVDAIVFGTALFGMAFVGTAMSEIKPLLQAARRKWIGDAPDEKGAPK